MADQLEDLSRIPKMPNILQTRGSLDLNAPVLELHMEDGSVFRLLTSSLLRDSSFVGNAAPPSESVTDALTIPLIEERLEVGKRVVATGTVRLQKTVQEYYTQLDETLAIRTFDIERVAVNRMIEKAPAIRTEGDKTIYPVIEEQLILTRQLVLKEEIHVIKRDSERHDTQTVSLRREHVTVERNSAATQTPSETLK